MNESMLTSSHSTYFLLTKSCITLVSNYISLQNNLAELVSLLNFLHPDIFTNHKAFEHAFDITNNLIDKKKMQQSQKVLDLFMLRRLKTQVEKLLPKKVETKVCVIFLLPFGRIMKDRSLTPHLFWYQVYCPLSKMQVSWYKQILMKDIGFLAGKDSGGELSATTGAKLLGMFMQLRKACIHPFLFDGAEPEIGASSLQDLVGASGKLAVLDALLISLFKKGHRCVLFSQFTSMLDILADYCNLRGWNYHLFDGRTPRAKRNYFVNSFNAPDSPVFLFLMSTRSGSMGLNLQTADTCILFDSDQNPQQDLQAQARVHRIGQTKTVHVYRLVAAGTVEERMVQRAEKKLLLDQMVNRERADAATKKSDEVVSGSEMMQDLKFGCAAVFGDSSQNALPSKEDIASISDRKRTENDSNGKVKGGVSHTVNTYDVNQELSETQVFGGVDFRKLREEQASKKNAAIPKSWRDSATLQHELSTIGAKRQVKKRLVMVDGNKSGYGTASVPVLASNNYDLENGESSVFARELSLMAKGAYAVKKIKRKKLELVNQEWCQHCGDGGLLHCCNRCPISAHVECFPRIGSSWSQACSHHWCSVCSKPAGDVGGFLYPCQSCPAAYCEDCLPKDVFRIVGRLNRFEEAGYDTGKMTAYIHCTAKCEQYAREVWNWNPPNKRRQLCPEELDVSKYFGGNCSTEKSPPRKTISQRVVSVSEVPAVVSASPSSSSESSNSEGLQMQWV